MSNFYCLKCDKLTRHFTMGTVILTGTNILRCSVCGEDQQFTKEDYVKMPKNVYERCEENKRKGNSRELFLQSYHNLREVMCSRNESTERKYVVFQGFLQDYIRCDLTEADITTAQSIIKEFEMRMAYEPFVQHPELKRRAEIILAQKRRENNNGVNN